MKKEFEDYEFVEMDENDNEVWIDKDGNIHRRALPEAIIEQGITFSFTDYWKNGFGFIKGLKYPSLEDIKNGLADDWNEAAAFMAMCASRVIPFDEEEYERCKPAVDATIKFLESNNYTVIKEPFGKKDIDLKAISPKGTVFYIEPELAKQWGDSNWKFPKKWNIHFLCRKWKYRKYKNAWLVTVRSDCKVCYFTAFDLLTNDFIFERKEWNINRKHPEGEWMVDIYFDTESHHVVLENEKPAE